MNNLFNNVIITFQKFKIRGEIIIRDCKLILFDMDGTLIRDRTIFVISKIKGFNDKLLNVLKKNIQPYQKSLEIAEFLKGFDSKEFLEIFRKIPLQDSVIEIIERLKENRIKIALATDSYQLFSDDLQKRLKLDYAFGNNLITKNDIITGELILNNNKKAVCNDGRIYSICKELVLKNLCKRLNIKNNQTIAVGDGIVDIGMIKKAGIGIAFNSSEYVQKNADIITNDLRVILDYI